MLSTVLKSQLRPAIALIVVLTVITGFAYPLAITAIAQVAFPNQANGSLVVVNGQTVGSAIVGQAFDDPKYFWSRPSAAGKDGYEGTASAGSNLAPASRALLDRIAADVARLQAANPNGGLVPIDLVTMSASGLDPDISPAAAAFQVSRVASARGMAVDAVRAIVDRHTEGPFLGFLGEPHVNVLRVNLDLDGVLR
jgi:K+-transporting ATPase ATPase C chain